MSGDWRSILGNEYAPLEAVRGRDAHGLLEAWHHEAAAVARLGWLLRCPQMMGQGVREVLRASGPGQPGKVEVLDFSAVPSVECLREVQRELVRVECGEVAMECCGHAVALRAVAAELAALDGVRMVPGDAWNEATPPRESHDLVVSLGLLTVVPRHQAVAVVRGMARRCRRGIVMVEWLRSPLLWLMARLLSGTAIWGGRGGDAAARVMASWTLEELALLGQEVDLPGLTLLPVGHHACTLWWMREPGDRR
jgi:hypothetical protein